MSAPGTCRAPLSCPSCAHEFTGQWPGDLDDWHGNPTGDQTCPACSHVFEATWPGFTFEPDVVVDGVTLSPEAARRFLADRRRDG